MKVSVLSLLGLLSGLLLGFGVSAVPVSVSPGAQPFNVYVGYADDLRADPGFPHPWIDDPLPNLVRFSPSHFSGYDCGAVRIDTIQVPVTVTNIDLSFPGPPQFGPPGAVANWNPKVDFVPGNPQFGLWQPTFPATIAVGSIGIVAQTTEFNLDTSDVSYIRTVDCDPTSAAAWSTAPANVALWASSAAVVTITYTLPNDGNTYQVSLRDSTHILDTGGFDLASCRNENHDWVLIGTGTVAQTTGSISLVTSPFCAQQYTLTGHALNPDGSDKAGAVLTFWIDGNVINDAQGNPVTCITNLSGVCSIHAVLSGSHNVQTSYGDYSNNAAVFSSGQNRNYPVVSGACGDPQFYGFMGQSFQVHGISGAVYNVISTPSLQYNALFSYLHSGRCRAGTQCFTHPGNYFGEVGLLLATANGSSQVEIVSGAVDAGLTLTVDGVVVENSSPVAVGSANVTRSSNFEVLIDTEEFNFRIENSDFFLNQDVAINEQLTSRIGSYKRLVRSGGEGFDDQLPHGILGQTWNTAVYANRWKHIEGQLFDYILNDGVFGTNFKYNRFSQ